MIIHILLSLLPMAYWFQHPIQIKKSMDVEISYIKWFGICIEPAYVIQKFNLSNLVNPFMSKQD